MSIISCSNNRACNRGRNADSDGSRSKNMTAVLVLLVLAIFVSITHAQQGDFLLSRVQDYVNGLLESTEQSNPKVNAVNGTMRVRGTDVIQSQLMQADRKRRDRSLLSETESMCDPDPPNCGCASLNFSDYRGEVNTTKTGRACLPWDSALLTVELGLVELTQHDIYDDENRTNLVGNTCRNPSPSTHSFAWCFVQSNLEEVAVEYCDDVPECFVFSQSPSLSTFPSSSASPSDGPSRSDQPSHSPSSLCEAADDTQCACERVNGANYKGTISTTANGFECAPWDGLFALAGINASEEYATLGLDMNYCRNPDGKEAPYCISFETGGDLMDALLGTKCDIPSCDPTKCQPSCDNRDRSAATHPCPSVLQAQNCCDNDDLSCQCEFMAVACRISLEMGINEAVPYYCQEADRVCCQGDKSCHCLINERMCLDLPSEEGCQYAAESCCGPRDIYSPTATSVCYCDFYNYLLDAEIQVISSTSRKSVCTEARGSILENSNGERRDLIALYDSLSGEHWMEQYGWATEEPDHCTWYGITCNQKGLITAIALPNNNLTGFLLSKDDMGLLDDLLTSSPHFANMVALEKLFLSGNHLKGTLNAKDIIIHRQLRILDLSYNQYSGLADLLLPPKLEVFEASNNQIDSVRFLGFNPARTSLRRVDLSMNAIDQAFESVILNIPPLIEELLLDGNMVRGAVALPLLPELQIISMQSNELTGTLPDRLPRMTPQLQQLRLGEQSMGVGLTGSIPSELVKLLDLNVLDLSRNSLTGSLPDLPQGISVFNISFNRVNGVEPESLSLLYGLEVLDLRYNSFEGDIPAGFGKEEYATTSILMQGNDLLSHPAPLSLCGHVGFDLRQDESYCPIERNSLKSLYIDAKGNEWTESDGWLDEYEPHCKWENVLCDSDNKTAVTHLLLRNDGLSGSLTSSISDFKQLRYLDLSDNDLKGPLPESIGRLTTLKFLKISFNSFTGTVPSLVNLTSLELLQLHGNRFRGEISPMRPDSLLLKGNLSSYISDCGSPSAFQESPLICEQCTICCNFDGDCFSNESTGIQQSGFANYMEFSWVYFVGVICCCVLLALLSYLQNLRNSALTTRSKAKTERDRKYALETIGDSVYLFMLGTSIAGWSIAIVVVTIQICMLYIFVRGAEFDVQDDNVDLVYTYQCTRDSEECSNKSDLDWKGWVVFCMLMFAHLMRDVINGCKMLILAGKARHSRHTRTRFFFGGTLLLIVTLFVLFTTTIYNRAIATSNTEIIVNSVIILFICDLDEQIYGILLAISPSMVEGMSLKLGRSSGNASVFSPQDENIFSFRDEGMRREYETLLENVALLQGQNVALSKQLEDMARRLAPAQSPADAKETFQI